MNTYKLLILMENGGTALAQSDVHINDKPKNVSYGMQL